MSHESDRARLEALAAAVLDGRPIDWSTEEAAAENDALRSAIRHLRVLNDVAALHGSGGGDADVPAASTPPSRWAHLRILEPLGRGSYGEVFRAWDETLDREVALKLLADDAEAIREGRALARVRHPNFVSVYGAERRDGRVGLWMEFIQGRTLARIVRDQGPFGAQEATLIGLDVCRSVVAVHNAGLLHRDIKAQNVMREVGGRIVLMDLGAGEERGAAALKGTAAVAGTPVYMAPEVIAGGAATVRSDVYSIGVLLFFLVTGTYPVAAERLDDLRRGRAPLRHLRDLRPDLPDSFVALVERATAADPNDRFPTAGAMERALGGEAAAWGRSTTRRRGGTAAGAAAAIALAALVLVGGWRTLGAPAPRINVSSIAVLPFADLSEGGGEYLADGIVDELIQRLSEVPSLRVISRTSSMYYRAHPKPLADVARELKVDAVIEGSVRRLNGRVRIDARLIDPRTDYSMWRRTMEQDAASLTDMPDNLARAVIGALSRTMRQAGVRRVDAKAYDLYLRGRYQLNKRTPEALRAARDLFDRAIERDATYAPAHAGLAEAYTLLGAFHVVPRRASYVRAREAANDALRLDDTLSMPYAVLGSVTHEVDQDLTRAFDQFRAAIDRDPNNPTARQWYAVALAAEGRYSEATAAIERARELDPLSNPVASDAGNIYRLSGHLLEALVLLRPLVSLSPEFAEGHRQLALVQLELGEYADAAHGLETAVRLAGPVPYLLGDLGYAYARLGRGTDAERVLSMLLSQTERREDWYDAVVIVDAALGRIDHALAVVDACHVQYAVCMPELTSPGMEAALQHPRLHAAVRPQ